MCAVSVISDYTRYLLDQDLMRRRFKKLVEAEQRFAQTPNQPDCPSEEKVEWLEANGVYY